MPASKMKYINTEKDEYIFSERGQHYAMPRVSRMLDVTYKKPFVDEQHLKMLAVLGTAVHSGLHGKMQPELIGYANARKKFLKDYGLKSRRQEFVVKSKRYWYAGTADESCSMSNAVGFVLIDWKTGAFQKRYMAQLNLYDLAFTEEVGFSHDKLYCVTINADGTYKPTLIKKDWGLGINVIQRYEQSQSISNVVPACHSCNITKNARTPEEWAIDKQKLNKEVIV